MLALLAIATLLSAGAQDCENFSNEGGDYFEAISDCTACAAKDQCGFCLSTLQCLEQGSNGPSNGLPCNYWLTAAEDCPEVPQCEQLSSCGVCVDMDGCAWCASEQRCLTVSEIFITECEGSIFDTPCPSSPVSLIDSLEGNAVSVGTCLLHFKLRTRLKTESWGIW